jgi:hypothetical protein
MKLKVQNVNSQIMLGGNMESLEEAAQGGCDILIEDGPSVYKKAIEILETFPRFKEIIINTELTDDCQDVE